MKYRYSLLGLVLAVITASSCKLDTQGKDQCGKSGDCLNGYSCVAGLCVPTGQCTTSDDCFNGYACAAGRCAPNLPTDGGGADQRDSSVLPDVMPDVTSDASDAQGTGSTPGGSDASEVGSDHDRDGETPPEMPTDGGDGPNVPSGDGGDGGPQDAPIADGGDGPDGSEVPVPASGMAVRPWPDGSPAYARAIVKAGPCTGTVIEQDWVLTSKSCGARVGDPVTSFRQDGQLSTIVDGIIDGADDDTLLHLQSPLRDLPAIVPLYWGTTQEIVSNQVTCYGYRTQCTGDASCDGGSTSTGLWAVTLSTRPHGNQVSDPGTFETSRNSAEAILPDDTGGPCFFQGKLVSVTSAWSPDRTSGLQTSLEDFRPVIIAVIRGTRARFLQTVDSHVVYFLDRYGQLWRVDETAGGRKLVDSTVRSFAVLSSSVVYVLGLDRNLWREEPDAQNRTLVSGDVWAMQPIDESVVYTIDSGSTLWHVVGDSTNRTFVDGPILNFKAMGPSHVFVLGWDRLLWNEIGSYMDRTVVDDPVADFQPLTNTAGYVLRGDFALWYEVDSASFSTPIDSKVLDMQGIDASLVYVLDQDSNLWRESATSGTRDLVDVSVAAFQAVDATTVYVLGQDGSLWHEQGTSATRTLVASR